MEVSSQPHILLFPFMSKGHTIPLLRLAKLIHHKHRPRATFTVFTTPANEPFISHSLASIPTDLLTIISLPFPSTPELPPGVESTDKLPSMALLTAFMNAAQQLQSSFEEAVEEIRKRHENVTFLISDGFLFWTQELASKLNIPRLVFYGMSSFVPAICRALGQTGILFGPQGDDELIQVPDFPWISVTRNDFEGPFREREPKGPQFEFILKCGIADSKSYCILVNSFYQFEAIFLDYLNSKFEPKFWPIGPLCCADKTNSESLDQSVWFQWLNQKSVQRKPVLYVAFGSQAEISDEQLKEIVIGLEKSEVDFLWALRIKTNQDEVLEGFEDRVKDRGLVVREWVEQKAILEHESIQGFLSHCGWNSVLESTCASVPILAWPMMAEQHLNARMVVDEIKVGLRVETCDGSVRGFVKAEGLSKMVKELMEGEKGKKAREKVKELSETATKAVEQGESSWNNLETLLSELETTQISDHDVSMTNIENDIVRTPKISDKVDKK